MHPELFLQLAVAFLAVGGLCLGVGLLLGLVAVVALLIR